MMGGGGSEGGVGWGRFFSLLAFQRASIGDAPAVFVGKIRQDLRIPSAAGPPVRRLKAARLL